MPRRLDTTHTFKIKGQDITLTLEEMYPIHREYGVACTAEYIYENYNLSEGDAWSFAKEVRDLMLYQDYTEEEAIDEVLGDDYESEEE